MSAWYLAEDGADVTLVEAHDFGSQASGANAGSIHLQIQYPEFVSYGEDWARAYAPSLRLLTESIRLWQDLLACGIIAFIVLDTRVLKTENVFPSNLAPELPPFPLVGPASQE